MRILWISHFVPYPPAGGALQRSFHLLRHTADRHEVHLLALHQPRLLPTDSGLDESVAALTQLCASVRVFPIPAERSRLHRLFAGAASVAGGDPFDVTWLRSGAVHAAIAEYRADSGIGLAHVDTVGLWPSVAGWRSVPIALGHHNIESELILRRVEREPRAWRAALFARDAAKLRRLESSAASLAAVNIVVSALDAERLRGIAPTAAVEVVANGVDTDFWQPGPGSGTGIVFAGTLGWYPNRDAVEFLLSDIWPALLAKRADRRLVLVGRDPPPIAMAAAADSRVQVTGFVPDVRPYLRDSSISICPMRIGGGTRLKILDALAMGKPLVSTAIGVEGLDLVEDEHYLRAETAEEFVAQIDRLESDSELRSRLGAAGRARVVDRYDWRVIGKQLDRAYARALAGASSHDHSAV